MFLLLSLSLLIMSQHSNEIVHLSIASASMCDISVMPGISLMLAISAMSTMFAMSLDCQVCHICSGICSMPNFFSHLSSKTIVIAVIIIIIYIIIVCGDIHKGKVGHLPNM